MKIKNKLACLLFAVLPLLTIAQENSPYSRYGVGNLIPQGNIINRSMGGISAALSDPTSLNTVNPAAPASILYTTLDIGVEYNGRNLVQKDPIGNFRSHNGTISYLQVALPVLTGNKKAFDKKIAWSFNFGLKPISKINYKIETSSVVNNENVLHRYEGNGGINEAFAGTALKIKNLSLGINSGYLFGEKDYNTRIIFKNDSVAFNRGNYETNTRFGGMFLKAGAQYQFKIKEGFLRLGAYGNFKNTVAANKEESVETFTYNQDGASVSIDSVYSKSDIKGEVRLPSTLGMGFVYEKERILLGADFETTAWDDYRFFGEKDLVANNWTARAGVQFWPVSGSSTANAGYFNFVKYRAGVSFGQDYIVTAEKLPFYTVSAGAGFPLKVKRSFYETQYSVMNIGLEYGNRGNKNNNISEKIFRISVGFSLSDVWFRRQKYQ